jgi:NADH dehydrogenase
VEAITFTDGETMPSDQFVWTGGIRGPDALDGERPVVRNTLRYEDGTFVVGDAGRIVDTDGEAVPASAQAAIREAGVAADNIVRLVEHERSGAGGFEPRLDGYRFDSLGWLVSIGDGAVAQVGPTVLTGQAAKALKTSVGAGYLSSVGAVENAVDLVREEVGWPEGDDESVEKTV